VGAKGVGLGKGKVVDQCCEWITTKEVPWRCDGTVKENLCIGIWGTGPRGNTRKHNKGNRRRENPTQDLKQSKNTP